MKADEIKTKKNQLEKYIQDFLEYCEVEKNRSMLTVENYDHYLKRFAAFSKKEGVIKPEGITLDLVRHFRIYLNRLTSEKGKGLKLITQNYHIIAVRAFLKYLSKRDVQTLAAEKIELPKNPSREVSVLTHEEIERLFEAVNNEKSEILKARDLAILQTLFSTGLRISELVSIKRNSINLKRGEFTVRGKGDKLRLVFLSPEAIQKIQTYLKLRGDNHTSLFLAHSKIGQSVEKEMEAQGNQGKETRDKRQVLGLTPRSVQRLIQKYGKIAGIIHKVTPHTFRHSFATDLLQNGADIRSVQSLLGHASITTTQIYTHITNEGLRDIHKKFHNKK